MIAGRERPRIEERYALPEECLRPGGRSNRLLYPVGVWIGQRGYEVQPAVLGRNKRRVLTEPALNDVAPPLAKEPIEDAVPGPHNGLVVYLICNP